MTIYTIKGHPEYRIVERFNAFYPQKYRKFMFFRWWGSLGDETVDLEYSRTKIGWDIRRQNEMREPTVTIEIE